eukprot:11162844-Lingulodinium_polyedra.AAC.1
MGPTANPAGSVGAPIGPLPPPRSRPGRQRSQPPRCPTGPRGSTGLGTPGWLPALAGLRAKR